ncbi:cytochrome c3 family protein [Aureivirga marina]|uniref:cytochrome c3 family protein n=1 Tax=Aureivirga marina TaxID=1182451 RepID=UPI0018CBB939|nr:cytochrome c3 family protein [Aureivirga marina]
MQRFLYIIIILTTLFSCKTEDPEKEYGSLHKRIEHKSEHYKPFYVQNNSEIEYDTVQVALDTVAAHHFGIPKRTSMVDSYPCNKCHAVSIDELKSKGGNFVTPKDKAHEGVTAKDCKSCHEYLKKSHWNISLNHADDNAMNCATCHNQDEMNNLSSLTNKNINFNNSYQICSQCHSTQFNEWKNGAHGKQLTGWGEPKVRQTCVGCHNPHDPAIKHRWPSRLNTQMIEQRDLE